MGEILAMDRLRNAFAHDWFLLNREKNEVDEINIGYQLDESFHAAINEWSADGNSFRLQCHMSQIGNLVISGGSGKSTHGAFYLYLFI